MTTNHHDPYSFGGPLTSAAMNAPLGQLDEAVSAGAQAAVQRLMRKLYRDTSDADILILSDSTGTPSTSWVDLLTETLADRYPAYSVEFVEWDDGTLLWGTTASISTGTGTHTLTVWNGSVGGKNLGYFPALAAGMVNDVDMDLILVSLGHNESFGNSTQNTINGWRDRMLAVTESVTALAPFAGLIIIAQNPRVDDPTDTAEQALRLHEWASIAERRGYGWVDVFQAFWDTGDPGALTTDGYHPTTAGYQLWHDTLIKAFVLRATGDLSSQPQSSLLELVPNLLPNGDLADFSAPPTLPNWTALSATLTKDTTNYESVKGWSVNLAASAGTTSKILTASGDRAALARRVRGYWVTLAARIFPKAGDGCGTMQAVTNVEQIAFSPGPGAQHFDLWQWNIMSFKVPSDATSLYVTVNSSGPGDATADLSIDRVILVRGILPRDCQ